MTKELTRQQAAVLDAIADSELSPMELAKVIHCWSYEARNILHVLMKRGLVTRRAMTEVKVLWGLPRQAKVYRYRRKDDQ